LLAFFKIVYDFQMFTFVRIVFSTPKTNNTTIASSNLLNIMYPSQLFLLNTLPRDKKFIITELIGYNDLDFSIC